jgi:CheY-like chemotaxis protein
MAEQSQFQYRIHTASSGKAGLHIMKSNAIDLVLCDIVMPGMDGFEFLAQVHANPNWVNTPVIFLTGRSDNRDVQMGRRLGVDEYIIKPYNPDELYGVVEARLERHRAVQTVYNATFQELRQSVLDLLGPHFINPLDTVADHSQVLLDQVSSAETIVDLKGSLIAIEHGSRMLVDLVDDFTMLVELRTGAAQSAYDLRAEPIHFLGDLVQGACETALLSAESTPPILVFNFDRKLPAIIGDMRFLTYAFQRLTSVLINHCASTPKQTLTATACQSDSAIRIKLACPQHRLSATDVAQISALMDNQTEDVIANPALGSAFIIVTELIALHNGHISMQNDDLRMEIAIDLPTI